MRMLRVRYLIGGIVAGLCLMVCAAAFAVDTLVLKDATTCEGLFEGYKNKRIYFKTKSGKKLHETLTGVVSLVLDPPSKVIVKPRSGKKTDAWTLKSYGSSGFVFDQGGKDVVKKALDITRIELGLDFGRKEIDDVATVISEGEEVDIAEYIENGVGAIVHFHSPDAVASVRQGTFVTTLVRDSRGKLALLKIEIPSWDSPVAKQYGITSAPRFRFYNRRGKLVEELTERFTEEDIEAAVKKAMRYATLLEQRRK